MTIAMKILPVSRKNLGYDREANIREVALKPERNNLPIGRVCKLISSREVRGVFLARSRFRNRRRFGSSQIEDDFGFGDAAREHGNLAIDFPKPRHTGHDSASR